MSYILDALKRAEAERERGLVPGLHARQVASFDDPEPPTSTTWQWLIAAAVVLVLVAAGAGFWWWHTPAPDTSASPAKSITKVAAPEAPVVATAVPAVLTPSSAAPSDEHSKPGTTSKPRSSPAPVATVQVKVAPQVGNPQTAPVTAVVAVPTVAAVASATAPLSTANLTPQAVTSPQPTTLGNRINAAASAAGQGVPLLSDLPEAMRRQIPTLVISGAVQSEDPSQRLLLVNNQAFGQGNAVAPGVQLEEIQATSSIFIFQGTRFQLAH
jgi:general secretion pathway protein B